MTVPLASSTSLPREVAELTVRGVILGALITVIFTASNIYLGLKVGLTFSSAIPSAIISMAALRAFSGSNILENNMVQTQASAAGTLSSVIFIIPGLLMVGHWQGFPFLETFGICAAGGALGVIFTIPLRHAMVVESDLPYPEGVAAAEVLRVGEQARLQAAAAKANGGVGPAAEATGTGVADIAAGGIVSALVALATSGLRVLSDSASYWTSIGPSIIRLPIGFSLALLGAGYLIGIVAGIATLLGVIIAWGIAIPILTWRNPVPAGQSIIDYANHLWSTDVRFIGAGMIAVASVWTLLSLAGPVVRGVRRSLRGRGNNPDEPDDHTTRDIPLKWIAIVALGVIVVLMITFLAFLSGYPQTAGQRWLLAGYGVAFAFLFGFLISAACGYMAGIVGSSSSPISGIGIIGTILVSMLILATGAETGLIDAGVSVKFAIAFAIFTTSAVVAVAAVANDNLQDLKTGWLVGASPWRQQVALLIGVLVGAAVIPPILELLYNAFGFPGAMPRSGMDTAHALAAPQATLMATIAAGIFQHQLNWTMLKIGALGGVFLILVDYLLKKRGGKAHLPVLAVGIGVYLPPISSVPLALGAFLAWGVERGLRHRAQRAGVPFKQFSEVPARRGVLIASGLIVGESLFGVLIAGLIGATGKDAPLAIVGDSFGPVADVLGLIVFCSVAAWVARRVLRPA